MREAASPDERIARAFRLAVGRAPTDDELTILGGSLVRNLRKFRAEPDAAEKLLSVGDFPRDKQFAAGELAAYTAVANLILNLDEAVTKE
jgi:hypothetical protein